ncbi:MAG: DUF6503 family protein [Flavobacteriaceae bacterium]|nr:DUF6503 family protein [Flavobacteriaceae bacterium]
MKKQFNIILVLLISLIFLNKVSSQNEKIQKILLKSLNAHGGEVSLNKIKQIKYLKTTFTYNKVGDVKKRIKQHITHKFDPFITEIISDNKFLKTNGTSIEIIENGKIVDDLESLKNAKASLDGAFYVFWQPMKLKDSGTLIKYLGEITLPNKKNVHSLKISYLNGKDIWKFYFDTSTYLLVATEVDHNNKISLIYTTDFNTTPFGVFHHKRKSYNLTENRSKLTLQASYLYEILDVVKE